MLGTDNIVYVLCGNSKVFCYKVACTSRRCERTAMRDENHVFLLLKKEKKKEKNISFLNDDGHGRGFVSQSRE